MGCGGCGKRKRALRNKIREALRKAEEADRSNQEVPAETKQFLDNNVTMVHMMKREDLLAKKKELLRDKKDIPFEMEAAIEEQSKLVSESMKTLRRNKIEKKTSQQEIINKIVQEKSVAFVPQEFRNFVKIPLFDPSQKYSILTDKLAAWKKRSIRRNERVFRRQLTTAIEMGDTKGLKSLSKKYGEAIFDLYLLLKREMMDEESKES